MTETRFATLVNDLRSGLTGRVVERADDGYDAMRAVFPGGVDRRPALIVRPKNAKDVQHTVRVVRDAGVPLVIRSGGHTIHCTTDDGVVLDLRKLSAMHVDVSGPTAWAETGLTAAAYSSAVGAHGMATGFGDTGNENISPGLLIRRPATTIDSVKDDG